MLENDEDERWKEVNEAEFEEESAGEENVDSDICYGNYIGDDGTETVIPSYLLSPEVRTSLSQSVMLDPCEMDSLLNEDNELHEIDNDSSATTNEDIEMRTNVNSSSDSEPQRAI